MQETSKELIIGGIRASTLADKFKTPLYVMDISQIRKQCRLFKSSFSHRLLDTEVIYASKAFLTVSMARLIHEEGLSLDVVSGGELYTAIKAGFPMSKIYFHGNNKSDEELKMALNHQVGHLVIDYLMEYERLCQLIEPHQTIDVLVRINPGIEAHTHQYIKTTHHDSKFGMSVLSPETLVLIEAIDRHPLMHFHGFHSHIGSQIFEQEAFIEHAKAVLDYAKRVKDETGIIVKSINLGGGFGATYTKDDHPIDLKAFLPEWLDMMHAYASKLSLDAPKIMIEPGRAIVAEAGYTLYEVGGLKTTVNEKKYVFVDGSMADHLRTALYQATYRAVLANRMDEPHDQSYTVAGKACESGDILIHEAWLPEPQTGDLLAVLSTGAYHYSMSSNYNRLLKPAVVFVEEGKAMLAVKRETYQDLIRHDM